MEADVRRRAHVSGGYEGEVFASQVSVGPRKVYLAEKVFRKLEGAQPSVFGDPVAQFKMVKGLIELNKRERLGLRLPKTVRLAEKKDGEKTLLTTPLHVVKISLDEHIPRRTQGKISLYEQDANDQFMEDRERQIQTLESHGYSAAGDAFFPVMGPDGRVVAALCDFGNLKKNKPYIRGVRKRA